MTFCQSTDWKMHPTNEPRKERPLQLDHVFVVTKSRKKSFFCNCWIFSLVWKRTPLNQTLPESLSQYIELGGLMRWWFVREENLFEQALDLGGTFSSIESVAIGRWARYGDGEGPSFKVSFQALIYGRRTDCQLKLSSPVPSLKEEMKNWCRNWLMHFWQKSLLCKKFSLSS